MKLFISLVYMCISVYICKICVLFIETVCIFKKKTLVLQKIKKRGFYNPLLHFRKKSFDFFPCLFLWLLWFLLLLQVPARRLVINGH